KRGPLERDKGGDLISHVLIQDRAMNYWQDAVFELARIVVRAHHVAPDRKTVLNRLVVPMCEPRGVVMEPRSNRAHIRLWEIKFEDADVAAQTQPGWAACRPRARGGRFKILFWLGLELLNRRSQPLIVDLFYDLVV